MKILVTGGAGFIGSNIVDRYIELGHEVVIVDDLSSGKKDNINPKAVFYEINIQSDELKEVFDKHNFDVVNHHAAQIDVRKSVDDPVYDAQINVIGLLNLLENCRKFDVKKVVFISSGGVVYGDPENKPPTEDYPFAPESPYGVTKMVGEYYVRYYSKVHGLRFTALRYSNVYGPRQDPHGEAGVIAIFSNLLLEGKVCTIFGDGEQTRDYVFVEDVVEANVLALDKGNNESFNIGTGIPTSVNILLKKMASVLNCTNGPNFAPARKGELKENYLNSSKAKNLLGWNPRFSLDEGLRKTIEWFKQNVDKNK